MTTRTVSEANFSPRKDSKRQNILTAIEAESALDADELKGMLAARGFSSPPWGTMSLTS